MGVALAEAGMRAGRQVSWLPSYGPEMRGGTANCHVTISDRPIGSPLVSETDVLVAMLEGFVPLRPGQLTLRWFMEPNHLVAIGEAE